MIYECCKQCIVLRRYTPMYVGTIEHMTNILMKIIHFFSRHTMSIETHAPSR